MHEAKSIVSVPKPTPIAKKSRILRISYRIKGLFILFYVLSFFLLFTALLVSLDCKMVGIARNGFLRIKSKK